MKEIILKILKDHFRGRILSEQESETHPKWVSFEKVAEVIVDELAPHLQIGAALVLEQIEQGFTS